MMIVILIVSWNVRELLRACLQSLATYPASTHAQHIVVVDNASSDGTVEMLRADFPAVHVIANLTNRGFTGGNNDGLRWIRHWGLNNIHISSPLAVLNLESLILNPQSPILNLQSDYIFLLNPDTEVTFGALDELLTYADMHLHIGIIGPQLHYPDGSIQSSRRRFPTLFTAMIESTWLQALTPQYWLDAFYMRDTHDEQTHHVDWVMGAAMLTRYIAYAKIGELDEINFFMYSEELDWCKRMVNAGWQVVYHPAAIVIHHEGKSSEQASAQRMINFNRSKVRYFAKHHGVLQANLLRVSLIAQFGWQMGVEAVKWLIGHRQSLRVERLFAYAKTIAALSK